VTPEQNAALAALVAAHALYTQADAHRIDMMDLCKALGVPTTELRKALNLGDH
jgi:DNA-binding transcriptional MerR regulator